MARESLMEEMIAELSLERQVGIILSKSRREEKEIQVDKKQEPVQQSLRLHTNSSAILGGQGGQGRWE